MQLIKTRSAKLVRFLSLLGLAVWAVAPRASAQTPAGLDLQLYAGLTLTGAVGTVTSAAFWLNGNLYGLFWLGRGENVLARPEFDDMTASNKTKPNRK